MNVALFCWIIFSLTHFILNGIDLFTPNQSRLKFWTNWWFTIIEWVLQSLCICWRTFRKWSSSGRRETEWICLPCAITSFGILCSYFSITSIGDIGSKDFCGRRWWCCIWGTEENDCSVREQSTLILHVNYWGREKESYLAYLICKKMKESRGMIWYELAWMSEWFP